MKDLNKLAVTHSWDLGILETSFEIWETLSNKQKDNWVENKHMELVTPEVGNEDTHTNSKIFTYVHTQSTELLKTKIFGVHCELLDIGVMEDNSDF